MKAYPLILNHAQTVMGANFRADIKMICAVLLRWNDEDQLWSCEPVRPHILWASGKTIGEANTSVRSAFTETFAALAHGETHEQFDKLIRDIVGQVDHDAESAWTEALRKIRAGNQISDVELTSMKSEKIDGDAPPCHIKVVGSFDVKTMVEFTPQHAPWLDAMIAHQPEAANNDLAQAA